MRILLIQCLFASFVFESIKNIVSITDSIPCSAVIKHVRCIEVEQMSQCSMVKGGLRANKWVSEQANKQASTCPLNIS